MKFGVCGKWFITWGNVTMEVNEQSPEARLTEVLNKALWMLCDIVVEQGNRAEDIGSLLLDDEAIIAESPWGQKLKVPTEQVLSDFLGSLHPRQPAVVVVGSD